MYPAQRKVLKENRLAIVDDLEPKYVLDYLLEDGVLTENDAEQISSAKTRKERCHTLLSLLPTRGPSAYGSFKNSLKKSSYIHLERILDQADATVSSQMPAEPGDRYCGSGAGCVQVDRSFCSSCECVLEALTADGELSEILRNHCSLLIHNVDPVDLLDCCYQNSVLSDDECDWLRAGRTRKERCVMFFQQLLKYPATQTVQVLKEALSRKYSYIITAFESSLPECEDKQDVDTSKTPKQQDGQPTNRTNDNEKNFKAEVFEELNCDLQTTMDLVVISKTQNHQGGHEADDLNIVNLESRISNPILSHEFPQKLIINSHQQDRDEEESSSLKEAKLQGNSCCSQKGISPDVSCNIVRDRKTGRDDKCVTDVGFVDKTEISGDQSTMASTKPTTVSEQEKTKKSNTSCKSEPRCDVIAARPGASSLLHLSSRRLSAAFNCLSTMINQGHFQQFETRASYLRTNYPDNHDLMCVLCYLNASRDLFRTDYESAKNHIKSALQIVPKTSNPQYFTLELFTAKLRMYIGQKRLQKLQSTIDDVMMLINSDPLGCGGRAAGWLFFDDARNKAIQLDLINFRNEKAYELYNTLHSRARVSFQRAMENFQQDGSKDGPFGFGYALCRLVILLLRCGDNGLRMNSLSPPPEDIDTAASLLGCLKNSETPIPKVLNLQYTLAKCDYYFRRTQIVEALKQAEIAHCLAQKLNLLEFTEHAHNRVLFLQTRRPLVVKEIH